MGNFKYTQNYLMETRAFIIEREFRRQFLDFDKIRMTIPIWAWTHFLPFVRWQEDRRVEAIKMTRRMATL